MPRASSSWWTDLAAAWRKCSCVTGGGRQEPLRLDMIMHVAPALLAISALAT
jgi:hypothetical protein